MATSKKKAAGPAKTARGARPLDDGTLKTTPPSPAAAPTQAPASVKASAPAQLPAAAAPIPTASKAPAAPATSTAKADAPAATPPAAAPASVLAQADAFAAAPRPPSRFPIVGIGASAGGLKAYEALFKQIPTQTGMGFVLIQHLDPSHASMLTQIIQRSTTLPVVEAEDQMAVRPDHIYVIPPNREMAIFHGALQLSAPIEPRGQRMAIDAFLRSLAEDQGENAVAIILSGTGTDGTLGLRAIHAAGGLCLVQEPATAKYDGMPRSAIQAGYVSQVMPVESMPHALEVGMRRLPIRLAATEGSTAMLSGLNQILMLLRSSLGHDFSLYKKSTITRRVERRMAQHDLEQTADYLRYLKEHPIEVRALFRELLINVTSFFRDPDAFALLKTDILPGLLAGKPAGHTLRVWVAGCATGEEAFSIAMVLRELMDENHQDFKVQMYATDLDDEAITVARAGLYPPNVAQDVSPERLRRFFVQEETQFRVCKAVREMVVFAIHNVIKDPPFTKLDLVSCRNVMIYLEPELQDRLVPALHYALNPGGVLFLSPSESIGSHTELFEPIQRKWKFFRARPGAASSRTLLGREIAAWPMPPTKPAPIGTLTPTREAYAADIAKRSLLQSFAPAAVLTDLRGNILYVHGEVGDYLRTAPGYPTHNIVDMAREGLQVQLREMLGLAASRGQSTLKREVTLRPEGHPMPVSVGLRVLADPDPTLSLLLVSFEPGSTATERPARMRKAKTVAKPPGEAGDEARRITELEREVMEANDRIRVVQEERLSVTEELKSFNEELQSTNEELQSTNEELETSKEELQSVNEELVTLNAELQIKVEEVTRVQDDMKNLLDNMRIGTIFLDRHLVIRRFTRDATKVYRLVTTDVGRPLADIRTELQEIDLLKEAQGVLDTLVPFEREITTASSTWYLARIQPYRTMDNVIDGVVLTFTDITERIQALAVRKARDLAEAVIDTVREPLLVLDSQLKVVSANRVYEREFNGTAGTTVGQSIYEIGHRQWDLPALHLLLDGQPTSPEPQHCSVTRDIPGAGPRPLDIDVRRIGGPGGFTLLTLLSRPPPPPTAPAPP